MKVTRSQLKKIIAEALDLDIEKVMLYLPVGLKTKEQL